jgi:uncharacterized protein (TIGR01244 family)
MRALSTPVKLNLIVILAIACGQTAAAQTPATSVEPSTSAVPSTTRPAPADLLRNGKAPFDGVLTGGQPTPDQLATLAELGYKTVVNLRSPGEEGSTDPAVVESLGMDYVSLPISNATDINETNGRALAEILEEAEYPVVVHCASGNRVGAVFAMMAFYVDDETPEEALAIGRAAGVTRLEPVVKEKLGLE